MLRTFRDMWRWRRLIQGLARRDFQLRYRASVIGFTWTLLEPAVQFALYFAAFSLLLGTRFATDPAVEPFGLFVISGLVPFWAFQETFVRAASVVREHSLMVRHAKFPLEALLSATMLSIWARHGLAFVLVTIIAGLLGKVALASAGWALLAVALLLDRKSHV
jgi:lipopolysaccharide transport system permease protein